MITSTTPSSWHRTHLLVCAAIAMLVNAGAACGQVIAVPSSGQGAPTMTFLFPAPNAKATLIFVPGGEGRRGMQPDWTESHGYFSKYHFNLMLRGLADPQATSGSLNVVIFDNPTDLVIANHWSVQRAGSNHLSRVEDVVRHYKEKLERPVWVMGHSMGSISVTELYKRLQDNKNETLVAGLIISGGQTGTSLRYETTKLPVLVLHHEKDGCVGNLLSHARRLHSRLRESGNSAAELFVVDGGTAVPSGNPCRTGYHTYLGATAEISKAIDDFARKHLASESR